MSLLTPGQFTPHQVPSSIDSVPDSKKKSKKNALTQNAFPSVQTKVPKSEFKALTKEWNATHKKLTDNFRELNIIFSDIAFLLQQLESQLEAAGIKSEVGDCIKAAHSCLESFANANANASALDAHINKLDKSIFDNAPQDIKNTFKKLTEKVTEAGNLGKAIGIPGAEQNPSSEQSISATAQLGSAIKECKDLLPEIGKNVLTSADKINSVNGKIKGLKNSPQLLENGSKKIRSELAKIYKKWETAKSLFDQEKKKKDAAISLGVFRSLADENNYKLKLEELKKQSADALNELKEVLEKIEKITDKTQSMLIDLQQLDNHKTEINSSLKSIQLSSFEAHIDLNDSLQKINQSNLGKKGKKEIEGLITAFDEKDKKLENQETELQLIEDELLRLNKFISKISTKNLESKSACEKMQSEIMNEYNGLIWM